MSPQPLGTPHDEQAIRNLTTELTTAWNRNDANALAALYAQDADLIDPSGRVARGRTEVEKLVKEAHGGPLKGTRISLPKTHVRFLKPDIAIADYDFEIANMRGADGKQATLKGIVTCVLQKTGEKWQIAADRPLIPAPPRGAQR